MNFDFSDEEKLIQDQTARYLSDNCGTDVVRSVLESDLTHAQPLWEGLAELGLMGTAIAQQHGGVEAGPLALCLVARELGAKVAPVPFASTVYLLAQALQEFGSVDQQQRWLPKIAAGEVKGAVAVVETLTELRAQDIQTSAKATANNQYELNGAKTIVADGGCADLVLVLARTSTESVAEDGLSLFLVEAAAAGVTRNTLDTVDPSRDSARLEFSAAPGELVGALGAGWGALQQLHNRAAVLLSFEQLGGAQSALDMAVAYAKERFAFGRPIGSFQGLKHMMADMYVALKLAESNCYYAAWALASDAPELPLAAATARVSATKAYQRCASDNIQVHGGMGFTWEFDCHLYYRRSNYLALQLGGLSHWENQLVNRLAA